tara:strand:- start:85 stop:501 length:417 start_codon:yes stop_codon:yes gene_type:complete
MKNFIIKYFEKLKKNLVSKFIIFGIINTIFGYIVGIVSYHLFYEYIGAIGIGIVNNIVSITFSFTTFKIFVFQTKNTDWFLEYLRSFVVYFLKGILGMAILWACLEIFKINIYLSQAISMISTAIFTYKGHKNFTFRV